jgi:hypothetical protein
MIQNYLLTGWRRQLRDWLLVKLAMGQPVMLNCLFVDDKAKFQNCATIINNTWQRSGGGALRRGAMKTRP